MPQQKAVLSFAFFVAISSTVKFYGVNRPQCDNGLEQSCKMGYTTLVSDIEPPFPAILVNHFALEAFAGFVSIECLSQVGQFLRHIGH